MNFSAPVARGMLDAQFPELLQSGNCPIVDPLRDRIKIIMLDENQALKAPFGLRFQPVAATHSLIFSAGE